MPSIHQLLNFAALAATGLALPLSEEADAAQIKCPNGKGAMVLTARGSDPGYFDASQVNPDYDQLGDLGNVAHSIANKIGHKSFVKALPYPAVQGGSDGYSASVGFGVDQMHSIVQQYANQCGGKANVVVLGFSQGAQVMTQALKTINENYRDNIRAAAVFGDPTFVKGIHPLDADSDSVGNGDIANSDVQYAVRDRFRKRARSYCREGDIFCSSAPGNDPARHLSEPSFWQGKAVHFVTKHFN